MHTLKFFYNFERKILHWKNKILKLLPNLESINIFKCIMKDLEKDGNLNTEREKPKDTLIT